jgi:hypothetical protein
MSELQDTYQIVADAYPDIGKKIKLFWGNQEFTDLMYDLLNNTRGHLRDGFPFDVVTAFLKLQELHNRVFPQFAERSLTAKVLIHRPSGLGLL